MATLLTPDICVIGAGPGGLAVARAATALGASVVVIDKAAPGGHRLHNGGVALAAFVATARRARQIREAADLGLQAVEPEVDFKAVMRRVRDATATPAPDVSPEHLAALGITFVKAEARFKSRRVVAAGETDVRARRFVLATGSNPLVPVIPGLSSVDYLTEDSVFSLERLPPHLIVIGGGDYALPFAQAFRRLGSKVTLLEPGAALPTHDTEMAAVALRAARAEGLAVLERCTIASVERRGKAGVRVTLETPTGNEDIDGSTLLVSAGRTPCLDGLELDQGRVAMSGKAVDVSKMLRTTNRRVYAIGEVTGAAGSEALAIRHAEIVTRALLFRMPVRRDASPVPRLAQTDPEIAQIGLTEAEASARRRRVRVIRVPVSASDRAVAEGVTDGHVKLVLDRAGTILGVGIAVPGAGEMAPLWALVVERRTTLEDVAALRLPYPTISQICKQAAMTYLAPKGTRPFARLLARLLRLFG